MSRGRLRHEGFELAGQVLALVLIEVKESQLTVEQAQMDLLIGPGRDQRPLGDLVKLLGLRGPEGAAAPMEARHEVVGRQRPKGLGIWTEVEDIVEQLACGRRLTQRLCLVMVQQPVGKHPFKPSQQLIPQGIQLHRAPFEQPGEFFDRKGQRFGKPGGGIQASCQEFSNRSTVNIIICGSGYRMLQTMMGYCSRVNNPQFKAGIGSRM
jgi:hypothetical protein